MTSIWTSDIHLDASPKNEYRWSVLPWLESTALTKRVDFVGINGDLTEAKDKHPATMVNRIVEFFAKSKNQWVINTGNHDCVSEDTEVLTKRGWLHYNDIKPSDVAFGINIDTNKGEWQNINNVIIKQVKELWSASGTGFDILCSSRHRVMSVSKGKTYFRKPADACRFHFVPCSIESAVAQPSQIATDDELRLLAWILTDGRISNDCDIDLYQSKHLRDIDLLLYRLNIKPTRRTVRYREITQICGNKLKEKAKPSVEWHFPRNMAKAILSKLEIPANHTFPKWLYEINKNQFQVLLDTIIKADGSTYKNRGSWLAVIYKSKEFLSQLQSIAVMHGYRAIITYDNRGDPRLNLCKRRVTGGGKLEFTRHLFDSKRTVWCLAVPHGNFLVRRNGKPHFTGNCFDPNTPFFKFMNNFENIRWIHKPTSVKLPISADYTQTLILPSSKEWSSLWPPFFEGNKSYPYVFVHATFDGTRAETGVRLSGIPTTLFPRRQYGRIFAGDIHIPGEIGERIDYIGSPHRVYFGDTFEPRVLWISKKEIYDINPMLTSRHVIVVRKINDLERFDDEIRAGDQVKIRVRLRRSDFPEWGRIRKELAAEAGKLGWDVHGIELMELMLRQKLSEEVAAPAAKFMTPKARMLAFAEARGLSEVETKFGISLIG